MVFLLILLLLLGLDADLESILILSDLLDVFWIIFWLISVWGPEVTAFPESLKHTKLVNICKTSRFDIQL